MTPAEKAARESALFALGPWAERAVDSTPITREELIGNVTHALLVREQAARQERDSEWNVVLDSSHAGHAALLEAVRREERERWVTACEEHDRTCLDPHGCDVMTIAEALRRDPKEKP